MKQTDKKYIQEIIKVLKADRDIFLKDKGDNELTDAWIDGYAAGSEVAISMLKSIDMRVLLDECNCLEEIENSYYNATKKLGW